MATNPAVSRPRRREVAEILGDLNQVRRGLKETKTIPIGHILVFSQTRKTFDEGYIDWLASDIRTDGLNNPLQVVRYSPEHFTRFLQMLNMVWRTKYRRSQFKPVRDHGRLWYFALIAGECRIRALRRIGSDLVKVTLSTNLPPIVALKDQQVENQYNPPPAHEQAFAWQRMYSVLRLADPALSLAAFSRFVHKHTGTVRKALQFCELPEAIQFAVQRGDLRYGLALELVRLHEYIPAKPDFPTVEAAELVERAEFAILHKTNVREFRRQVHNRLTELRTGQTDMFQAIAAATDEAQQKRLARRKMAAKQHAQGLTVALQYMRTITSLVQAGQLGGREAPLSDYSVRRKFRMLLDQMEQDLDSLDRVLRQADRQRSRLVIKRGRTLLNRADQVLGTETVLDEELA